MCPNLSILNTTMKLKATLCLIFCLVSAASAQFNQALRVSQEDLRKAEEELAALEARIAEEKLPLAKELNRLETLAIQLRDETNLMRRAADSAEASLITMQDRVKALADNNSYLMNILNDYISRWKTTIHLAELPQYLDDIVQAQEAQQNSEMEDARRFSEQLDIVEHALRRVNAMVGGATFKGGALVGPNNALEQGNFALVGPLAFFASSESEEAGIAIQEIGSADPRVESIGPETLAGVRELVNGGKGVVPVDFSLGEALRFANEADTIPTEIGKGGMVMWPILGLFAVSMLIVLIKTIQLMGVKQAKDKDLDAIMDLLRQGKKEEALKYGANVGGPVGELLKAAVEHADADKEVLEEVLYEVIIGTQPRLESMLPFVAVTAAVAPLLGLLGTVMGMIQTFKIITVVGTGDAGSLSSGISVALITTKWGLIVAIPTLICHALLSRMARGVIGSMEQAAVGFINGLAENQDEQAA